ncbi:MAG: flavin reductase family protein [Hyphomicrobiaceae bacterium]
MKDAKINPFELRAALGAFVTGVTVVTTRDTDGTPRGFTANSFTSVSLDPPLVLVCLAKTAGSFDVFERAGGYAVNILAESQRDVSTVFTTDRMDRFDQVGWEDGPAGHPVFKGTAAWLDCTMHSRVDAGDHLILIGRVQGFDAHAEPPLGYCRGAYVTFGLEQEAVAAGGRPARIGAILEYDDSIFVIDEDDGRITLPSGRCLGDDEDPTSLHGALANLKLDAELGFLFAVFEEQSTGDLNIFYRGTVEKAPKKIPQGRFVPFNDIDPETFPSGAERSMMARYLKERKEAQFGIYVGDNETGHVHAIAKTAPQ